MQPRAPGLLAALTCLGLQACFFSPSFPQQTETSTTTTTSTTPDITTTALPVTSAPDPGTTSSTSATSSTSTTDPTAALADSSTTTDPSTTSTTTGSDTTSTTSDSSTTGAPDCPPIKILELVEDADISFPMTKMQSMSGEGMIASSPIAMIGSVEFTVDISCPDTYTVWARVYDDNPGPQVNDPDSFTASVDGMQPNDWIYGCETKDEPKGWSWQRITALTARDCDSAMEWTHPLEPGAHLIKLLNRESEVNDVSAAVARILVTNDPDYTPTNE